MAERLKIEGNFLTIFEDGNPSNEYLNVQRSNVAPRYDENDFVQFFVNSIVQGAELNKFDCAALIDDRTGLVFTSVAELKTFLRVNLGVTSENVSSFGFIEVSSKSDFPETVSGVITLIANYTYYITTHIDLTGDRLVGASNTTILGASSENCSITSTGLGTGIALITTTRTMPIRHITIKDVDTAFDINGSGFTAAYDWTGLNLEDVPSIGTVQNFSNFIFSKGAFLNSKGLILDGTFGTFGADNSLFQGDGLAGNIISIASTAVIERRFRIIYSAFVVFGSTTGVNANSSATIPVEGYILDTVNFSGGGTYTDGVQYNDNKALFRNCRGINNSAEIAAYSMNGNLTTTVISATGTPTKILGTTVDSALTEKFSHTNNRQTYVGALTRIFKVTATLSCESGNNNQVGCYIAKNGVVIPESVCPITTNGSGRYENADVQALVELQTNDYIETFTENNTATNNILVTDLNVIIQ